MTQKTGSHIVICADRSTCSLWSHHLNNYLDPNYNYDFNPNYIWLSVINLNNSIRNLIIFRYLK